MVVGDVMQGLLAAALDHTTAQDAGLKLQGFGR